MTGRALRALVAAAAVPCVVGAAAAAAAQTPPPLRVCVESHSLPMSMSHPDRGIDVELARAIGQRLERPVAFVWHAPGIALDRAILDGRCDLAPGAVLDEGSIARSGVPDGLALTTPYAGAGYLLLRRADAPPVRRLSELGDERIGVEMESVAIYTLKQRGHRVYALDDYSAVIRALADGRIDYGYLWGPLAAWVAADREELRVAPEFEPVERWDLAFAVAAGDAPLRSAVDRAIAAMVRADEVAAIFGRWGVPYLPPRATAASGAPAGARVP